MADEIRSKVEFETGDSVSAIDTLERKLSELNGTIDKLGNNIAQFNTRGQNFPGQKFQQGKQQLTDSQKAAERLGKSVQTLQKIIATRIALEAFFALRQALEAGVQAAIGFQLQLAEIQTIAGEVPPSLAELANEAERISEAFGVPLEQVAEGVYQTLSNQVTEAADAFRFLESAQRFATATVSSTADSVNLLSSALNAFGIDASQSDEVAGKLFKTIELGRIRASELANTFGRVATVSAQLGVSLDETLAFLATLTTTGLKTSEAITRLTNVELKLLKPTEALKAVFDELGIASAEAGVQAFGLVGLLERVTEAGGDSATEIAELFGRVRAAGGALGVLGNQSERAAENLRKIREAGARDAIAAFERVADTNAKNLQRSFQEIRNFFVEDLGQPAVAALSGIFDTIGGGVGAIAALAGVLGTVTVGLVGFGAAAGVAGAGVTGVGFAAAAATPGILAFGAAIATAVSPLLLAAAIGAGIGIVIAGFDDVEDAIDRINQRRDEAIRRRTEQEQRAAALERQIRQNAINEDLSSIQQSLQERQRLFNESAATIRESERGLFTGLLEQVDNRVKAFESSVRQIEDIISDAEGNIRALNRDIAGTQDEIEQFTFDRQLRNLTDAQKAQQQILRSQELAREANQALTAGDLERAKALQQQAEAQSRAALSSADATQNAAQIFRAEQNVNKVLDNRLGLQIRARAEELDRLEAARQAQAEQQENLAKLQQSAEKLADAVDEVFKGEIDFEEFQKRSQEAGEEFGQALQTGTQNIDLLATLDPQFAVIRDKLQQSFTTEGLNFDLTQAVTFRAEDLQRNLQEALDRVVPPELQIQLRAVGAPLDPLTGTVEAQRAVAELGQELENNRQRQNDLNADAIRFEETVKTLPALFDLLEESTQQLRTNIQGSDTVFSRFLSTPIPDLLRGDLVDVPVLPQELRSADAVTRELSRIETAINQALQAGDAQGIQDAVNALSDLAQATQGINVEGAREVAAAINTIQRTTFEAFDLSPVAGEFQTLQQAAQDAATRLESIRGNLEELGTAGSSAGTGADRAASGISAAGQAAATAIPNLERAVELLAQAGGTGAFGAAKFGGQRFNFKKFGGLPLLYMQGGGRARGLDRVPTMLQGGEFIVSEGPTRRFFPQLSAITASQEPVFRQQGGEVTQNFGDINININEAASPREVAREAMANFNREIRKRTQTLRR